MRIRDVFEELGAAVERAARDHVEGDVGIAVVDPFPARAPGDHREDEHPEAIDQAGRQQRPAQGEASDVRIELGPFCFISRTASIVSERPIAY